MKKVLPQFQVTLACKNGFVRANADIKSTEIVCSVEKQGWDLDISDRMTCLRKSFSLNSAGIGSR